MYNQFFTIIDNILFNMKFKTTYMYVTIDSKPRTKFDVRKRIKFHSLLVYVLTTAEKEKLLYIKRI